MSYSRWVWIVLRCEQVLRHRQHVVVRRKVNGYVLALIGNVVAPPAVGDAVGQERAIVDVGGEQNCLIDRRDLSTAADYGCFIATNTEIPDATKLKSLLEIVIAG